jgi:hypothetical protein
MLPDKNHEFSWLLILQAEGNGFNKMMTVLMVKKSAQDKHLQAEKV